MRLGFLAIFIIVSFSLTAQSDTLLHFSKRGGVYPSASFEVSIDPINDTVLVFYTIDGSYPTSGSIRYRNPIKIDKNTVVRAVGYFKGKKGKTITQTYFVDRKYSLPVVSISCNPEDLFSEGRGIYAMGCCADTVMPYMGANFWKNWERRANIELYETDNTIAFNQECSIKIFGGFSVALPQKSLAIYARSIYGDNRFRYPIFPEKNIKKYKNFVLRNSGGDFNRTQLKDAFMTQMVRNKSIDIQAYRPAIVFLNGEYWGIQNLREKLNEFYLKYNHDVDKDSVYILRHNGEVQIGDYSTKKDYRSMLAFMRKNDLSEKKHMDTLKKKMDVYNYVRYNIAETYSDNRDAGGNIRYWKHTSDTAKWRWILYDTDMGLGTDHPKGYMRNTVDKFTKANAEAWPDPAWSTFIIRKLLENEEMKNYYINTFADFLNTCFHKDSALNLLDKMIDGIDEEMPYHLSRWKSTEKAWNYQLGVVKTFVKYRPYYLRKYIMQKFDLKDTSMVTIQVPAGAQNFRVNSLELTKNKRPFEGIYFVGTQIPYQIKVPYDYVFKGLEGSGFKTLSKTHFTITDRKAQINPIIEAKPKSTYEQIIINEWSVSQSKDFHTEDWFEIYNTSDETINLDGWVVRDEDDDHIFTIKNTSIPANGYLIFAENKSAFDSLYPDVESIGGFDFGFSSKGDIVRLYDEQGLMVDSLRYDTLQYGNFQDSKTLNREQPEHQKWSFAKPTPGAINVPYKLHLQQMEDEKKLREAIQFWSIVGGISVVITGVGVYLLRRYYKGKKAKAKE